MVINHDNYKWSPDQQLCARMTNFCTFLFALFFSLSLSLSTLIPATMLTWTTQDQPLLPQVTLHAQIASVGLLQAQAV
jgi:hypothetical protein